MDTNFLVDVLKMIVILAVVTGAVFAVVYFLKKLRFNAISTAPGAKIRLISSLHLGPKKSVSLVEVAGSWLVLGVGTDTITYLTQIEPPLSRDHDGKDAKRKSTAE